MYIQTGQPPTLTLPYVTSLTKQNNLLMYLIFLSEIMTINWNVVQTVRMTLNWNVVQTVRMTLNWNQSLNLQILRRKVYYVIGIVFKL